MATDVSQVVSYMSRGPPLHHVTRACTGDRDQDRIQPLSYVCAPILVFHHWSTRRLDASSVAGAEPET